MTRSTKDSIYFGQSQRVQKIYTAFRAIYYARCQSVETQVSSSEDGNFSADYSAVTSQWQPLGLISSFPALYMDVYVYSTTTTADQIYIQDQVNYLAECFYFYLILISFTFYGPALTKVVSEMERCKNSFQSSRSISARHFFFSALFFSFLSFFFSFVVFNWKKYIFPNKIWCRREEMIRKRQGAKLK